MVIRNLESSTWVLPRWAITDTRMLRAVRSGVKHVQTSGRPGIHERDLGPASAAAACIRKEQGMTRSSGEVVSIGFFGHLGQC